MFLQRRKSGWLLAATILLTMAGNSRGNATEIQTDQLELEGWHHATGAIANTACNYMYVDPTHHVLLYYGTSTVCQTRKTQHERAVTSARMFINAFYEVIKARKNETEAKQVLSQVATSLSSENDETLYGDACLTLLSPSINYQTYYIDLSHSMEGAADIEKCVLKAIKGPCNKIGNGGNKAPWKTVSNTLRTCHASTKKP